jgi:DNA-binding response OmpR family regulator
LADNERDYRLSLHRLLELEDYVVHEADSLSRATEILEQVPLDLVLADLRLGDHENDRDFSGLAIAKAAAVKEIPCIIITAYPTVEAIRLALRSRGAEALAEDLVPKAHGPEAILDAIKVVLGSRNFGAPAEPVPELAVDLDLGMVYLRGETLALSELQYKLIAYLARNEGGVCSREELIEAIYGEAMSHQEASMDKRLERLVARVRVKVEDDPHNPSHLIKEYGRGFRLIC